MSLYALQLRAVNEIKGKERRKENGSHLGTSQICSSQIISLVRGSDHDLQFVRFTYKAKDSLKIITLYG